MWDKRKIESLFPLEIVKNILEIPLFDMIEEDKLIWVDSLKGQYSVRSGYKLMFNSIDKVEDSDQHENWNCLWNIHAPPKAFLWRICKGCLPTHSRLRERCVTCPLICPICDQYNEDDWHIIFHCNDSILASQSAGLEHVVAARLQQYNTVKEVISSTVSDMVFVFLYCEIWWI
jgi:hypothetical protein